MTSRVLAAAGACGSRCLRQKVWSLKKCLCLSVVFDWLVDVGTQSDGGGVAWVRLLLPNAYHHRKNIITECCASRGIKRRLHAEINTLLALAKIPEATRASRVPQRRQRRALAAAGRELLVRQGGNKALGSAQQRQHVALPLRLPTDQQQVPLRPVPSPCNQFLNRECDDDQAFARQAQRLAGTCGIYDTGNGFNLGA